MDAAVRRSPLHDSSHADLHSAPPRHFARPSGHATFSTSSGAVAPLQKSVSQDFARLSEAESRCAALSRDNAALSRENAALSRENAVLSRENAELRGELNRARECAEGQRAEYAEFAEEMSAMREMLTTLQQMLVCAGARKCFTRLLPE